MTSFSISNTFATLFSLFAVGNFTSEVALSNQCPQFNYFVYFLRRQCPASVGRDLRCVIGLPSDVKMTGILNCATVDDISHSRLRLLQANEMVSLTRYRDSYGRPWCMLTLFFSPDCVFSARIAAATFHVAPLFPKLKVVAVDVSTYSRNSDGLIAQYGVLSTPLLALWENGFLVYRLYDDSPMNLSKLVQKIRAKTDLNPVNISKINSTTYDSVPSSNSDDSNYKEELFDQKEFPNETEFLQKFRYLRKDIGFDWYFVAALIATLINLSYFALHSEIVKRLKDRIRQKLPAWNVRVQ